METIKFKTALLGLYATITSPGRYELQVANNVSDSNLVSDEEGKSERYIVNLRAIAQDKLEQVKAVFAGKEEVEIDQTNGLFMTANIWKQKDKPANLPMKGEIVDVTVDFVESREGEQVLRITNIQRKAAQKAARLDVLHFFAAEEVAASVETGATLATA